MQARVDTNLNGAVRVRSVATADSRNQIRAVQTRNEGRKFKKADISFTTPNKEKSQKFSWSSTKVQASNLEAQQALTEARRKVKEEKLMQLRA